MGTANNPLVTLMTLVFGALIGVVLSIALAYSMGFISWDQQGGGRSALVSDTPGMDMLNTYQCRKSETKHIILGGIEDNFNLDNVEEMPLNAVHEEFFRQANYKNRIGMRDYDEGGTDKFAIDEFNLPPKTIKGLFVTRINPLSDLKNDGLTIGDMRTYRKRGNNLSTTWYDHRRLPEWRYENGLFSANLEDILFTSNALTRDYDSLLDYIRNDNSPSPVFVAITDDTAVDFMGFAICTEPETDMGMTYVAGTFEFPKNVVGFSCRAADEVICDAYEGDYSCSQSLPVVCFKDTNHEKPIYDSIQASKTSRIALDNFWSGGEIKLTPAIPGNNFQTEDQVNAYCAGQFGAAWRAASHHESYSDHIIGYGKSPESGTRAWMNVKDSPHGNCWKPRPDFKATRE